PTRWRPRPASQLTSAEAVADQRAINLGRFRARRRPDSIRAGCTPSSELGSEGETRAVRALAPDVKAVLDQPLEARDVCSFEFAIGLVEQRDGPLCIVYARAGSPCSTSWSSTSLWSHRL